MCVAVNRHAIGRQRENIVHRLTERIERLLGQSINKIKVDRGDTRIAQPTGYFFSLLKRLNTVDCLLHLFIGILHAQRGPIASDINQCFYMLLCTATRINFDPKLSVVSQTEAVMNELAEPTNLIRAQEGGGSTAEMHLYDFRCGMDELCLLVHLFFKIGQVGIAAVGIFGDHLSASAIPTEREAKGNMKIEGNRAGFGVSLLQVFI